MERIETDVRRQLARFDGLPPAQLQRLVEIWPDAVGETIAVNAWPARIARDGTLHVATSSSVWAFELGQLAAQILAKLGDAAPPRVRFAAGPLPERQPAVGEPSASVRAAVQPGPEEERQAAELAAVIDDDGLRAVVARAAVLGLARQRYDRRF